VDALNRNGPGPQRISTVVECLIIVGCLQLSGLMTTAVATLE
jgi:hypothetical protein